MTCSASVAGWPAFEPALVVETGGFDHQRVAFPVPHRIALPGGIGIVGQRPAVGEDLAEDGARFVQEDDEAGGLDDLIRMRDRVLFGNAGGRQWAPGWSLQLSLALLVRGLGPRQERDSPGLRSLARLMRSGHVPRSTFPRRPRDRDGLRVARRGSVDVHFTVGGAGEFGGRDAGPLGVGRSCRGKQGEGEQGCTKHWRILQVLASIHPRGGIGRCARGAFPPAQ